MLYAFDWSVHAFSLLRNIARFCAKRIGNVFLKSALTKKCSTVKGQIITPTSSM